ncbi:metallophosphoesterase family protein [Shewanella sp. YIC-542]|uniref:metallophosphoesterase family protein n=1 Tax=Shewanella mytili TaxID=3377111 RepID=UPI00398F0F36
MTDNTRRSLLKTSALLGTSLTLGLGLSGCSNDNDKDSDNASPKVPQNLRFAVLSDPHVYDPTLGTSGSAFEAYLAADRKMLLQGVEILQRIVANLLAVDGLQAVLIPGDLTKDGELLCHQKAISLLQPLQAAGIQVFVVPGNHDVNNPHAVAFEGDNTVATDSVTPTEFAELYADFGYGNAVARHESSLSYVAEPVEGVWLLALDSCKYDDNASLGYPETSGALNDGLQGWIKTQLAAAQEQGKIVIGMQHHGMVPHFASQPMFFGEYLIDDYENVGRTLSEHGLKLMFTGHFHAQDIIAADYNGDGNAMMYDIETGSCVTTPCPYRLVDFTAATEALTITSSTIDTLSSINDFASYKENFINEGMFNLYQARLTQMGLSGDTLTAIATLAAGLHVAHYKGDEAPDATTLATLQGLMASTDSNTALLGQALYALAVDSGLSDNDNALMPWSTTTAFRDWLLARQTA